MKKCIPTTLSESPAFLGCAYYKKKDDAKMAAAFEKAVKAGEKEGLAWTVYAYCLAARSKKAEAVAVLKRGIEKLPADERLQGNAQKHQRHHSGKRERTTSIYCVHFYGPFFGICLSPKDLSWDFSGRR